MADKIVDIEGIGPAYAAKLNAAGIQDTDDLFAEAGIKANRAKLAEETGISEKLILSWCNMADLMRLKGVGGQFAELLHAAGIDSCKELAQRKAENLHAKMEEVNAAKNLTHGNFTVAMVQKWIDEAKTLPAVISH